MASITTVRRSKCLSFDAGCKCNYCNNMRLSFEGCDPTEEEDFYNRGSEYTTAYNRKIKIMENSLRGRTFTARHAARRDMKFGASH